MDGYNEEQYLKILHDNWGYPDFRGIQRDIIRSVADGNDTLGLMPTGGGKSLTFQVPALAKEGTCIVITPLIALMKDQVDNLRRRGIIAAAIYTGKTQREIVATLDNCILGRTKLLYISPERIASELFQTKLKHMKVSLITVDEAHCISQWGYDFRPSYLNIAEIRNIKPDVPILALTATATERVTVDIQERLGFKKSNMFKMSFVRKNLAYVVRKTDDKEAQLIHILKSVSGSAIVYLRSRRRTKDIYRILQEHGISSTFYHAGLESSTKDERQRAWRDDEVRVMVATNAFGMGIDKPDVRLVIHYELPDTLEAYFQEAGRAGRDGKKAYAVMLYSKGDEKLMARHIQFEFPSKEEICKIYEHIAYFFQVAAGSGRGKAFKFDNILFCRTFHHHSLQVDSALKILEREGYVRYDTDSDNKTKVKFLIDRDQLYQIRDQSPETEAVLDSMLREFSRLFIDYGPIEEGIIADDTGLTKQQIYNVMKSLNQQRILHFIPPRVEPLITYTRDRVLPEEIVISKENYEVRKEQLVKKAKKILDYAKTDNVCRSRQLLRYFGEEESEDCGICDVCLGRKTRPGHKDEVEMMKKEIIETLSDGKRHHFQDMFPLSKDQKVCVEAADYLLQEETIGRDTVWFYLKDKTYLKDNKQD